MGAVEPVATLGGELPQESLSQEEKKKLKKKQQKVTARHTPAVKVVFTDAVLRVYACCTHPFT